MPSMRDVGRSFRAHTYTHSQCSSDIVGSSVHQCAIYDRCIRDTVCKRVRFAGKTCKHPAKTSYLAGKPALNKNDIHDRMGCMHTNDRTDCMRINDRMHCMHIYDRMDCMYINDRIHCMHINDRMHCMHIYDRMDCMHTWV